MRPTIQSIVAFALMATAFTLPAAAQSGQHADHHPETTYEPSPELAEGLARGVGSVLEVNASQRLLNLTHTPIESLGWPSMTMNFSVSSEIDLEGFAPGDAIEFDFNPSQASGFEIKALRRTSAKTVVDSLKDAEPDDATARDGHGDH